MEGGTVTERLETVELERPLQQVKKVYRGQGVAFIPHPHIRGAWVKVAPCVVDHACPSCNAPPGVLCTSTTGKYTVSHHFNRPRGA
jgi:hypothetical protein